MFKKNKGNSSANNKSEDIEKMKRLIRRLKSEKDKLVEENKILSEHIDHLKVENLPQEEYLLMLGIENENLTKAAAGMDKQLQALKSDNENLVEKVEKLQTEEGINEILEEAKQRTKQLGEQNHQLISDNEQLTFTLDTVNAEKEELDTKYKKELHEIKEKANQDLEGYKGKSEDLFSQNQQLRQDVEIINKIKEEQSRKINDLNDEIAELKRIYGLALVKIENKEEEISKYIGQLMVLNAKT